MTLQDNDKFLVDREETPYSVEAVSLTTSLEDTDLMLVCRDGVPYKATGEEIKNSLGSPNINPGDNDFIFNPAPESGTGTQADPYILKGKTADPWGASLQTDETITIIGQPPETSVVWTDNSVDAGNRFAQTSGLLTDANGTWSGKLDYADIPESTETTTYVGNLNIGLVYFRWTVVQTEITDEPTSVTNVSLIDSAPGEGPRFTSQSFVASSQVVDGLPISTKTIDAHVDGTLSRQVKFDEPLESSTAGGTGAFFGYCVGSGSTPTADGGYISYINFDPDTVTGAEFLFIGDRVTSEDGLTSVVVNSAPSINGSQQFTFEYIDLIGDSVGGGALHYIGTPQTITDLTFAADADMEGLAAGDAVSQTNDFTEPLESTTSDNTGTWVSSTSPDTVTSNWQSIAYGNGRYVAVADNNTKVMYSDDGINWTAVTLSNSSLQNSGWSAVTYGDDKFVAVPKYNENYVMWSTDGIDWTPQNVAQNNSWRSITYGNLRYVAVAMDGTKQVMYSSDAMNWQPANATGSMQWWGVTYGELPDGTQRFVAVANYGDSNRVMYSADGINWSATTSTNETIQWESVTYADDKFVAVSANGSSNRAMYSADGINWLAGSGPTEKGDWTSVTYGDGKFVAVGDRGDSRIMYSPDGINWTLATGADSGKLHSVIYGEDKFVSVGQTDDSASGVSMSSANGKGGPIESLTFANGTDMSALEAGDAVSQQGTPQANWSVDGTWTTGGGWTNLYGENLSFGGSYSDYAMNDGQFTNGEAGQCKWEAPNPIPVKSSVIIYLMEFMDVSYTTTFNVNNSGVQTIPVTEAGPNPTNVYDLTPYLNGNTFSSLEILCVKADGSNNRAAYFSYIVIDGVVLLDNGTFPGPSGTVGSITGTTATLPASSGTWVNGVDVTTGDKTTTGTVSGVVDTTATLSSSSGPWVNGEDVTGPQKTIVEQNARLYCAFDSSGNITDLQNDPQDPPYTTQDSNPGLTLTFPATFPSGQTPDEELTDGTTLTVEVTAENSSSTSGPVSATVQPEPADPTAPLAGLTTLYTGISTALTITNGIDNLNDGGLLWIKNRNNDRNNVLFDTERTADSVLVSNNSSERALIDPPIVWNDNGFTLPYGDGDFNSGGFGNYVAWNFGKAAGYFDVVKFTTSNATTFQTVPHSLGTMPGLIITKEIGGEGDWYCYHSAIGDGGYVTLNTNALSTSYDLWRTSDTDFQLNSATLYGDRNEVIAYLFAEDTSNVIKCGSYIGNGSDSGPTVTTGFEPQWLLIKKAIPNSGFDFASSWMILDNKRNPTNPRNSALFADQSAPENTTTSNNVTFNSDGFTIGASNSTINGTDNTLIYVAIAAPPVARSQTDEEFIETTAKFISYDNRKQVKQGEEALEDRETLQEELKKNGLSLAQITELFND